MVPIRLPNSVLVFNIWRPRGFGQHELHQPGNETDRGWTFLQSRCVGRSLASLSFTGSHEYHLHKSKRELPCGSPLRSATQLEAIT
jgi:hypothetical protein